MSSPPLWLDSSRPCAERGGPSGVGAIRAAAPELDDALVTGGVGVVDVEQPAVGVVGRERERQEALLAARGDLAAEIEERRAELAPVAQHQHAAALLDDELAPAVAGRGRDVDGRVERADAPELHAASRCAGVAGLGLVLGRDRCPAELRADRRRHLPRRSRRR
jgi:hypothetical protein